MNFQEDPSNGAKIQPKRSLLFKKRSQPNLHRF